MDVGKYLVERPCNRGEKAGKVADVSRETGKGSACISQKNDVQTTT